MILITGATGTIGGELASRLLDERQQVRLLVRDERKVAHLAGRAEIVVGDLDKPETLDPAMRDVERMFLVSFTDAQDNHVIAAAKRAGVRHIVKLSTLEAARASIRIGKWSRRREILIERSGLDWTFLRPGMFMSNAVDWWADTIRAQSAVYFPGGKGKVAPVAPADIAAVAALALTQPGHEGCAYELTGRELFTIGEMVGVIGEALGKTITYQEIPRLAAGLWMAKSGMSLAVVIAMVEMMGYLGGGDGAIVTDTVTRLTGRQPVTFAEWCSKHIKAFR
jgi:uncharacterized protein YbjT (DUF2867 family)